MKMMIILLALFVTVKSTGLSESRKSFGPSDGETLDLVNVTNERAEDFKAMLAVSFQSDGSNTTNVRSAVNDLNDKNQHFAHTALNYVKLYLRLYCEIALQFLNSKLDPKNPINENLKVNPSIINVLRFGNHDFCAVSFLLNVGCDVTTVFHTIHYLRTVLNDKSEKIRLQVLKYQLDYFYINNLPNVDENALSKYDEIINKFKQDISSKSYALKLLTIEVKIRSFSELFCLSTIPQIIDKDLLVENAVGEDKLDRFVNHVMNVEKFDVTVHEYGDTSVTQRDQIVKWDCTPIFKSKEYNENSESEEEIEDDTETRETTPSEDFDSMITEYITNEISGQNENKKTDIEESKIVEGNKKYTVKNVNLSLSKLKNELSSNTYFTNFVSFYNITIECLQYNLYKEGLKMMKGVQLMCLKNPNMEMNEIHLLKSRMDLFKLIADEIFGRILEKTHIGVTESLIKKKFYERLTKEIDDLQTRLPCLDVTKSYKHKSKFSSTTKSEALEDVEHYFVRPIYNVLNFYDFDVRTFSQNKVASSTGDASTTKNIFGEQYRIEERGSPNTKDYKLYIKNESGTVISPFHDIPLRADSTGKVFNMVVEIPKWTNAKMEINKQLPLNPITQDVKNGQLRFVPNLFPYKGYIWNYGAFPQTWENPQSADEHTGCNGDNDPVDVLEIGNTVAKRGEVFRVKVLGVVGLIDEGETDWKIIAINVNDPIAPEVNDIGDVEKHFPTLLRSTVEWLEKYKIPNGKPANKFAFDGKPESAEMALKIIEETHGFWKGLLQKETSDGISCVNTTLKNAATVDDVKVQAILSESSPLHDAEPDLLASEDDTWYYLE